MRFGFLRHYRKIRIEGLNPSRIIDRCVKRNIPLRDVRWRSDIEYTMKLRGEDYDRLRKATGHSCRVTTVHEGGVIPIIRGIRSNMFSVMGALLLGALLFYQSQFIAEVQISGGHGLDEAELRQTLQQAGVHEGAKKKDSYSEVRELLYRAYDTLTWVSIYEEGRLLRINIAEAGRNEASGEIDDTPTDIVASRSGMIESITPLQGNATVQKGDYVNEGDVLISGIYRYHSTDYSRGDEEFTKYSHSLGEVMARVPVSLDYYFEKYEREKTETGSSFFGIYIKLGECEWDSTAGWGGYEASVRSEKTLADGVKPIPFSIKLITVSEVELTERRQDQQEIEKVVAALLRQYAKEELGEGESILEQSVTYSEESGTIRADVMLETLQDIGKQQEIDVEKDKAEQEAKKNS